MEEEFYITRELINRLVDAYGNAGEPVPAPIPYTSFYAEYLENNKLCFNNSYRNITFYKEDNYNRIEITAITDNYNYHDIYNLAYIDGYLICTVNSVLNNSINNTRSKNTLMSFIGYDYNNSYIDIYNIVPTKELSYHQDTLNKFNELTKPKVKVLTK